MYSGNKNLGDELEDGVAKANRTELANRLRLLEFRNEAEEGMVYVRSLSLFLSQKLFSAGALSHGVPGSFLTKNWCRAQDKRAAVTRVVEKGPTTA